MLVYSPGGGTPVTLPFASGVQPNIAAGHGGYAIVATTPDGIWLGATGQETLLAANSIIAVDLAAHDTGWYVLWTSRSPNETNVFMAGTTTELGELVAVNPPVSEYTFANQDSPRFSTAPSGLWATWRTDWFDGDSSTVVFRNVLKAAP